MAIFNLFSKKSKEEDLTHLTPEGTLPFGWYTANKGLTEQIKEQYHIFWQAWFDSRSDHPNVRRAALEGFINFCYSATNICQQKGECFNYWFEHVIVTDDFVNKRKEEYKDLMSNLDRYIAEYEEKAYNQQFFSDLRNILLNKITDAGSVLQTDLYKEFPSTFKDNVSSELYYMEKDGIIKREKQGRTYLISIK